MRPLFILPLVASSMFLGPWARADDKAACIDASSQGQTLRDAHRLVEARDKFRACARQVCPLIVQKDCAAWLDQVQSSLPTVVPIATDASGNGLPAVKVSMDGKVLIEKADGSAMEVNPGTHTFLFEAPDGTKAEKTVLVGEGDKQTRVTAVVGTPTVAPAATPAPSSATPASPTPPPESVPLDPAAGQGSRLPWRTLGMVTGGVGVVGLGLGAAFGLVASGKKNDANCASSGLCPNQNAVDTQNDARSAGNLSTAFFIAGGVLAAAGVTAFVLAPHRSVQAAPSVGTNEAGVVVRGVW
jgi:hypothetical protein